MPNYITTYSGLHFDPLHPDEEKLRIGDIAHALSLLCRGNGHVKTFFSVGQHSVNCCREAIERGYSVRVSLACLLHDSCEAYLSDVPRPFKQVLPQYIEAEDAFLDKVFRHFIGSELTEDEQKLVKTIDDSMLCYDLTYLLNEPCPLPELKITVSYAAKPFEETEQKFLSLYEQLKKQLN